MSQLEHNRHRTHLRLRATRRAVRRTKQWVQEAERVLEESRSLLDRPVYPNDPRTAPKLDKS
ncbi:hypothetical protein [Microvirga vignae]|nr:hypothetical protein [Microvirga vignae]